MTSVPSFLAKIDSLQQQIADYGDWDEAVRKRIAYKFRLDWNYHSQSIEGGTLTRRETRTIMVGQVDVHGKPLKDVLEMTQHNEVIQEIMAVGKGQKRLSESRIRQIHAAIMHEEDPANREKKLGKWSLEERYIYNHQGERFDFAPSTEISGRLHDLLNRTNANWDKLERDDNSSRHPVLMALDFHLEFLTIHPFYDGNGRTARILLNLILISFGYPAIIVKNEDKEAYGRYIAEIQGYGAGRELYYEFMSGLLIRSQELVLQALAGEEIDEPDDLFKEIELFQKEQEAKAGGLELVVYSENLFEKIIETQLVPFFEELKIAIKKFEKMFLTTSIGLTWDSIEEFSIENEFHEHFNGSLDISSKIPILDHDDLTLLFHNADRKFDLEIELENYRYEVKSPFSIYLKVKPIFHEYKISIGIYINATSLDSFQASYTLLLRDGLPQEDLIRGAISAIFEELKKQTDKP